MIIFSHANKTVNQPNKEILEPKVTPEVRKEPIKNPIQKAPVKKNKVIIPTEVDKEEETEK